MSETPWFVYLLLCQRNTIYTGVTPNLSARMKVHRDGRGARFTRMNTPVRLLAAKAFQDKRSALQMEAQVKRMPVTGKRILAGLWSEQYAIDEAAQHVLSGE